MGWLKRRRLRKHLKQINFDLYIKNYGRTGEYQALCWLKAYIEKRTCSEPLSLVKSALMGPSVINRHEKDYLGTLLRWC